VRFVAIEWKLYAGAALALDAADRISTSVDFND
jgi:hypothetical protein